MYHSLYDKNSRQQDYHLKKEILARTELRKGIKSELAECLHRILEHQGRGFRRSVFALASEIANIGAGINHFLLPRSWEGCLAGEVQNLKKYYQALYTPHLDRSIGELLLEQKSRVEEYLIKPA